MSFLDKLNKAQNLKSMKKEVDLWWQGSVKDEPCSVADCEKLLEIYEKLIKLGDPKTQAQYVFDRPHARLALLMERLKRPGKNDGVLYFDGHSLSERVAIQTDLSMDLAEIDKLLQIKQNPASITMAEKVNPFLYHLVHEYLMDDYMVTRLLGWRDNYKDFQKKLTP